MTTQTVESHLIRLPSDSARTDKVILLVVAICLSAALVTLGLMAQPTSDADGSYGSAYENVAMIGL